MEINWFVFSAQIVNFLVLLGLLRYFFYDKIIAVIDKREKTIKDRFDEGNNHLKRAEEEKKSLEQRKREFENRKKERMKELDREISLKKEDLMANAHQELDKKKEGWKRGFERERNMLKKELTFYSFFFYYITQIFYFPIQKTLYEAVRVKYVFK